MFNIWGNITCFHSLICSLTHSDTHSHTSISNCGTNISPCFTHTWANNTYWQLCTQIHLVWEEVGELSVTVVLIEGALAETTSTLPAQVASGIFSFTLRGSCAKYKLTAHDNVWVTILHRLIHMRFAITYQVKRTFCYRGVIIRAYRQ